LPKEFGAPSARSRVGARRVKTVVAATPSKEVFFMVFISC
jgi:hypothetical protein